MGLPKIKNATQFRESLYETLRKVSEGELHMITQKDNEPVVMISKKEFDRLNDEREVLRAIALGVADLEAGRSLSHQEAKARFQALKAKWK